MNEQEINDIFIFSLESSSFLLIGTWERLQIRIYRELLATQDLTVSGPNVMPRKWLKIREINPIFTRLRFIKRFYISALSATFHPRKRLKSDIITATMCIWDCNFPVQVQVVNFKERFCKSHEKDFKVKLIFPRHKKSSTDPSHRASLLFSTVGTQSSSGKTPK